MDQERRADYKRLYVGVTRLLGPYALAAYVFTSAISVTPFEVAPPHSTHDANPENK